MRGEILEAERVHSIVAAFFTVYNYFGGGGLCGAAYTGALEYELTLRGHKVDREIMVAVYYKGKLVARRRLDMLVDDRVIVESKATERLATSSQPQAISYLRATSFKVAVLLHFGPHPKFYRFADSIKTRQTHKPLDWIRSNSRHSRTQCLDSPGGQAWRARICRRVRAGT